MGPLSSSDATVILLNPPGSGNLTEVLLYPPSSGDSTGILLGPPGSNDGVQCRRGFGDAVSPARTAEFVAL